MATNSDNAHSPSTFLRSENTPAMAAATIDQASKELIRYAGLHLQTKVMLVYDGAEADLNAQRTTCAFRPEWQDVRLDLDRL